MKFTKHEIKLLHHHMHFYNELRTGVKKADTPEREHFVKRSQELIQELSSFAI